MTFIETSAKESDNVEKLFLDIAKELTKQARANELKPGFGDSQDLGSSSPINQSLSACCGL